jgi:hypothetical protein
MKLNDNSDFTGWFGLVMAGYILVAINTLAFLGDYTRLDIFTRVLSGIVSLPGLFLLARYGFLLFRRLEDAERERKRLQRENDELRGFQLPPRSG